MQMKTMDARKHGRNGASLRRDIGLDIADMSPCISIQAFAEKAACFLGQRVCAR